MPRGARRSRRRAPDDREGRAGDEAVRRQAVDGEPRRPDVGVVVAADGTPPRISCRPPPTCSMPAVAWRSSRAPVASARMRSCDAARRHARRADREGLSRQGAAARRRPADHRRHRPPRHRAVDVDHAHLRHGPDPRLDDAVDRLLPEARPGARRADRHQARHIGIKYPVEIGLTGDMKATLDALQPLLRRKTDRAFLADAQRRMRDWNDLLDRVASTQKSSRLRPQTVVRALSDQAPANAVFSLDTGANTHFAARMIRIREGQAWSGTGMLASMASGPALRDRGVVRLPGSTVDRGRRRRRPLDADGRTVDRGLPPPQRQGARAEQRHAGRSEVRAARDRQSGVRLRAGAHRLCAVAEAVGGQGFAHRRSTTWPPAIRSWLAAPGVAVLDVQVDGEEEPTMPDKVAA